ncbi:glycine-rich protein 5-like [Juglans microcarpa x Juglans regia]|uniref:glycine-rich protein 5-like n=1 Tax=Juglans microcarpa x Juglans regia TaxID=2249226 RepID=UPI001B7DDACA|nr:glycine-rich protein 5-like [Juglans microcarpa x Juglans regia]
MSFRERQEKQSGREMQKYWCVIFVLFSVVVHANAREIPSNGGYDDQTLLVHASVPEAAESSSVTGVGDKKNFIYGGVGGFAGMGGFAGVGPGVLPILGGGVGGAAGLGGAGGLGGLGGAGGLGGPGGGVGGAGGQGAAAGGTGLGGGHGGVLPLP